MTKRLRRPLAAAMVLAAAWASACAPKRLTIPTGAGVPAPDYAAAFGQATDACRTVRSFTAQVGLSGRAGRQRLRGTLIAGFEQPASMRIEAVAPFGPPVFVLAARDGKATLLLERDNRFVTGVSEADILDALTGVRLGADALRAVLSGCIVPDLRPTGGRTFQNGWLGIDASSGATIYLEREQGQWRVIAGRISGFEVGYGQYVNGRPEQVTLQSSTENDGGNPLVNLGLSLSQVAINTPLKPQAFELNMPANAKPLALDELRSAGPLAGDGKNKGEKTGDGAKRLERQ